MSSHLSLAEPAEPRHHEPYQFFGDTDSKVVATAIHAGHDVRPEIADRLAIDEETRLREEDPFTDLIASSAAAHVVVWRSRFEVDLNRSHDRAVYRKPADSWGLEVWQDDPPADVLGRSLRTYESFYRDLRRHLDRLAADGPFLLLDIHSYNHRRTQDGPPAPQAENPDINVGTGSMDPRWQPAVDALMTHLRAAEIDGRPLDVRENIRFRGGHLARWVHETYPTTGCAPALEFKKTFMDEWTGAVDVTQLDALTRALSAATEPALAALGRES